MTTTTPAPPRDGTVEPSSGRGHMTLDAVLVGLVIAAGVVLRFVTSVDLWFDEAMSVNIAGLPLSELGDALRQDGAPPLYYVLLHFWIEVFGTGDLAVRALSGVFSVATLPLAYLVGKRIGGRSVGWWAVLLLAVSPFAVRYATESRMYALVMFLVLWGYLALRRALERPTLGRLAVVALVTALLVYTQYWSFYVVAVVGIGLLIAWRRGGPEISRASPRVIGAIAVGGLALLPWFSTLTYQLQHTGTPWADPNNPWFGLAQAFIGFAGGDEHAEAFLVVLPMILLPLLALFGAAIDERRIELDLRTRPAARLELAAAFAILILGLTAAWIGNTAFDPRYASVMYPLLVVTMALGLAAFADRRVRIAVLGFVVVVSLASAARNVTEDRTQAAESADVIRAEAQPGDLVVYCPDQIGPDVSRLLEGMALRHRTFPDGGSPERVDWVDYIERIKATNARAFARRMLDEAGDATIWYVVSGGYHNVEGKCEEVDAEFGAARTPEVRILPDDKIFELMGLTSYRVP